MTDHQAPRPLLTCFRPFGLLPDFSAPPQIMSEIRIYVACLAAYNNGILHGRHIDATLGESHIWEQTGAMLEASPIETAEEWAIHDYEGFEGAQLSEYASFEHVADMAEFIEEHGRLYLVQLDLEWAELDEGFNPKLDFQVNANIVPDLSKVNVLTQYKIGTPTQWKKLENLSIFDFGSDNVGPNLFLLTATDFETISKNETELKALIAEIRAVTADRAVVRTDCKDPGARSFNLPRTDTVKASEVPAWCQKTISHLNDEGLSSGDIGFLIHAFLPSSAAAWAYAKPGSSTVIVDALWGLPDGLQVLPVDTYEVNVARKKIIDTKSTFKPRFLQENSDGSWVYQSILRSKGRSIGAL